LFILLHHGGLLLRNKQAMWQSWNACGIPICASVSHGGAVLVQIPKDIAQGFITWFKGKAAWVGRMGTHGIIRDSNPEEIAISLRKELTETRKSSGGEHWGLNIAMGGVGKWNPFSGNPIAENGDHGHLYFYFDNNLGAGYAGMLIKCEDSAPPLFQGKPYSTGQGGHTHAFGGSGKYSCTGGKKWALHQKGPGFGEDNIFISLSHDFLQQVSGYAFNTNMLGSTGVPWRSRTGLNRARIYTVVQWEFAAKQGGSRKLG
jgi:Novel toxin 11